MAVNTSRSMYAELAEGATDGCWKKIPIDRSNVAFPDGLDERREMSWRYGFEDAPTKYRPDMGNTVARRDPRDHG